MEIGGIILASGMLLNLHPQAYLHGTNHIVFMVSQIVDVIFDCDEEWVIVRGLERPSAASPWRSRRLQVRVDSLKGCTVTRIP